MCNKCNFVFKNSSDSYEAEKLRRKGGSSTPLSARKMSVAKPRIAITSSSGSLNSSGGFPSSSSPPIEPVLFFND